MAVLFYVYYYFVAFGISNRAGILFCKTHTLHLLARTLSVLCFAFAFTSTAAGQLSRFSSFVSNPKVIMCEWVLLCYIFCDHNVLQFQPCDAAKDRNRYCGVPKPRTQEDEENLAEMSVFTKT